MAKTCSFIRKNGKRCKRRPTGKSSRCWMHRADSRKALLAGAGAAVGLHVLEKLVDYGFDNALPHVEHIVKHLFTGHAAEGHVKYGGTRRQGTRRAAKVSSVRRVSVRAGGRMVGRQRVK